MNQSNPVQDELSPKETLLWSGQPRQGVIFRVWDIFLIPFIILWMSPSVSMVFASDLASSGAALPFVIIPFVFMLVGGYLLVGRFWVDARRRKHTYYGLTTKRAIICSRSEIKSISVTEATELHLKQHSKGRATIRLGADPGFASMFTFGGAMNFWNGVPQGNCFEQINEPDVVYKKMQELRGL